MTRTQQLINSFIMAQMERGQAIPPLGMVAKISTLDEVGATRFLEKNIAQAIFFGKHGRLPTDAELDEELAGTN
jgi:hypothetical protein